MPISDGVTSEAEVALFSKMRADHIIIAKEGKAVLLSSSSPPRRVARALNARCEYLTKCQFPWPQQNSCGN